MPIINVSKKRTLKLSNVKINWGRGRLRKYESFVCFVAKFSRLNRITPKIFREFYIKTFNCFDTNFNEITVKRLSLLLNEPVSIVKTIFTETSFGWGYFSFYDSELANLSLIRYCPQCLGEGFHGVFHVSLELRKCAVHLTELFTEDIPYSPTAKCDRYIKKLQTLLDKYCPNWEHQYPKKHEREKQLKNIRKYFFWKKKAESFITSWSNNLIGIFGSSCINSRRKLYYYRDLDVLIRRINWLCPTNRNSLQLFNLTPKISKPININLPQSVGKELNLWLSQYDFGVFLYLFKLLHNNKSDYLLNFEKAAVNAKRRIISNHPPESCNCTIGIGSRTHFISVLPGELKYYVDYKCPFEIAANEITERWLNVYRLSGMYYHQDYDCYDAALNIYHNFTYNHELFSLTPHLEKFLDCILEQIVLSNMEELIYWLVLINNNSLSPDNRRYLSPNTYIFQHHDSSLQLISWPIEHPKNMI